MTHLLRAEAHYWQADFGTAAKEINVVRNRAKAPFTIDSDVTLDYIFDEPGRELYTEEPWHSGMIRASYILAKLNRDGYSLGSFSEKNWYHDRVMRLNHHYHPPKFEWFDNTAAIHPRYALWSIPQSVITANTLGRINQNLGYDGAENNIPPLETIE